ncbi:MAG: hypothetical protein SFW09_11205 [Hyphomicrobiaceae bacterium]|nr:hypothetical protein [Hyphomicrobiaceae bacterium]
MFYSLFKRAEESVDNAIASVLSRVLIAIPFIVAAGFATASLANYLHSIMEPAPANFVMALVFGVLGLIAALVVWARSPPSTASAEEREAESAGGGAELPHDPVVGPIDREILVNTLSAVGPTALPVIARVVLRNLPLVVAVAVAGFVVSRAASDTQSPSLQPGE